MLYLEDYLEMIEHLPQELRDRFTEMRELDLSVQNSMDSLDKQQRTFFSRCKQGELQEEDIQTEYENLRKEYYKVLEEADEKVTIASQIHELVDRYLRRLDSELFKFKCELEADNNGITEILEKRSLEMDSGSAASALLNVIGANQKENRYYGSALSSNNHGMHGPSSGALSGSNSVPTTPSVSSHKEGRYRAPKPEKRRDSLSTLPMLPEKRPNLGSNTIAPGASPVPAVRPVTPSINSHAAAAAAAGAVLNTTAPGVTTTPTNPSAVAYNLQQLGGGAAASNAIAAAASQAIVATQQMQQGRRTASLKASYEAIHGAGGGPTEFWISRDIANAAASAAAQNSMGSEKKQKKKMNTSLTQSSTLAVPTAGTTSALSLASSSSSVSLDSTDLLSSTAGVVVNSVGAVGSTVPQSLSLASLSSGGGPSTSAAAANRANSASSSTSTSSLTPSSNLNLGENGLGVEQTNDAEWSYDPNEPRYCTCQQVSYGDMVACDNDACPYEWFHYPCVGITQPPKGKWYCPKCTVSMRRRGNRKN